MRNKRFIAALSICLCGAIAFAGCGKKESTKDTVKSTSSTKQDTSKKEVTSKKDTSASDNESSSAVESTTAASEATTKAADSPAATSVSVPTDAGSMILSAHALALCESETGFSYSTTDNNYFWNATAYLLAGYGIQSAAAEIDDEGILSLYTAGVQEFAASLFASYDGNTSPLPDIPAETNIISFDSGNDCYKVAAGGFSSTRADFGDCSDNGDGTYTIKVTLKVDDTDGESLGVWNMTIKPSAYAGSGHPLFNYSVVNFVKA